MKNLIDLTTMKLIPETGKEWWINTTFQIYGYIVDYREHRKHNKWTRRMSPE